MRILETVVRPIGIVSFDSQTGALRYCSCDWLTHVKANTKCKYIGSHEWSLQLGFTRVRKLYKNASADAITDVGSHNY